MITTVRKKQDYDMSKDDRGKTVITKVGMKEVTRDGFEYELTLSFGLSQNNLASVSKDRTNLFMNKPEFIVSQETGKTLLAWVESGVEDKSHAESEKRLSDQRRGKIKALCDERSMVKLEKADDYREFVLKETGMTLDEFNFPEIIKKLSEPLPPGRATALQAAKAAKQDAF